MNPIEADLAKPTLSSSLTRAAARFDPTAEVSVTVAKRSLLPGLAPKLAGGAIALAAGFFVTLAMQYVVREHLSTLLSSEADGLGPTESHSASTTAGVSGVQVTGVRHDVLQIDVQTEPPTARLWLDGKAVGTGHFVGTAKADGTQHELRVEAAGYTTHVLTFREHPPYGRVALMPDEPVAPSPPPPLSKPNAARVAPIVRAATTVGTLAPQAGRATGAHALQALPTVAPLAKVAAQPQGDAHSEAHPFAREGSAPDVGGEQAPTPPPQPVHAAPEPNLAAPIRSPHVRLIDEPTPQIRVLE